MKKLLIAAFVAASVGAVADQYTQAANYPFGIVSQTMTDSANAQYSSYAFDDFTVGPTGWTLQGITAYGEESGNRFATTAVHYSIQQNASFTNPGTVAASGNIAGNANLDANGNIIISGLSIALNANTHYWLSVWIDRPFGTGGQWNWKGSTPNAGQAGQYGSAAMWQNPQNGFGYGSNPVATAVVFGEQADLALTLDYIPVPEPATMLAIGTGLAALAARRRRK